MEARLAKIVLGCALIGFVAWMWTGGYKQIEEAH